MKHLIYLLLPLLLPLFLSAEANTDKNLDENLDENITESFITDYEYGEMLFANPRGVSCVQCHGASGEGKVIVSYKKTQGKEALKGADIRKKTLDEMIHASNSYHEVMPSYYLTDDEIAAIYEYLQKKNERYLQSAN